MSAHTPGPWYVADHDDFVIAAGDGFSVCDCQPGNPYDVTEQQAVANARLIAAAPELYAALREFLDADVSGDREVRLHGARAQARAALAKAQGAQS